MSGGRQIRSAEDLVPLATLTDITFHTVSAERGPFADEDPAFTSEPRIELATMQDAEHFALKMDLWLAGDGDVRYRVAASVTYTFSEPVRVDDEALADFISRVAALAVYPFVREAVVDLAGRLRAPVPVLGLLRPGDIRSGL